jgi:3-hydroxybutyryl-CoA dehydrogenase
MRIVILCNEYYSLYLKSLSTSIDWITTNHINEWNDITDADGYFNLNENSCNENYSQINMPVFINAVSTTLKESHHHANVVRMNGWNGFIQRNIWEVAGNLSQQHVDMLNAINKSYTITPDELGFIAPRILSMIINEAYFAKEQNVSTETEIDTAMKLGTNYPKGPFEWKEEIGISNIFLLLEKLSKLDSRYNPSQLLVTEANSL